jgi:hypothetical protein
MEPLASDKEQAFGRAYGTGLSLSDKEYSIPFDVPQLNGLKRRYEEILEDILEP